jgi:hypothetical protein
MGVATTPRFTDHLDGTVTDNLTGLMWTKDAQQIPGKLNWQAALDACNNLVYPISGVYEDWRLPNKNELLSLIDHNDMIPALPPGHPFINVVLSSYYWSSTTHADYGAAWGVGFFSTCNVYEGGKSNSIYGWCVRGGQ